MSDKNEIKFSVSIDPREAIREAKELASKISEATKKANVKGTGLESQQKALQDIIQKVRTQSSQIHKVETVEKRINEYLEKQVQLEKEKNDLKEKNRLKTKAEKELADQEDKYKIKYEHKPDSAKAITARQDIEHTRQVIADTNAEINALEGDITKLQSSLATDEAYFQRMKDKAESFTETFKEDGVIADEINAAVSGVASKEEAAATSAEDFSQNAQDAANAVANMGDDTEGVKTKAEEVAEAFENLKESTEGQKDFGLDLDADVSKMDYKDLHEYIEQLQLVHKVLEDVGIPEEYRDVYNRMTEAIVRATTQLNMFKGEVRDVHKVSQIAEPKLTFGIDADVSKMSIDQLIQHLSELKARMAYFGTDHNEFKPMYDASIRTKNAISDYAKSFKNVGDTSSKELQRTRQAMNLVAQGARFIQKAISSVEASFKKLLSTVKGIAKKIVSVFKSIGSMVSGAIRSAFDKLGKSSEKAFSFRNLKRSLNMLTKYLFGVRSFFFLYRKLRAAVTEGLKNLVQYESASNETNHAISELRTSLLYLKNAWAAAFAPIINYVYPVLVKFLDLLASVGNAIARFVAFLTGADTVLQAVKVDAGDYADSLKDAAGGASKAAKAQDDLNDRLAAFDDLNVLGVDDDKTKTPSGGGGGGSLDDLDPNTMFERIQTPFNKLADMIRTAWETGDAFDLGHLFAQQFGRGIDTLTAWLNGEGKEKIHTIASMIGTFIDGFLSIENLGEKVGRLLKAAFSDAFDAINTIITPDRAVKIGRQIAEAMNTAIPDIVPELGETLGNLFKSAIAGMWGWITTADFKEWGVSLGEAFNNFLEQMNQEVDITHVGKGTLDWDAKISVEHTGLNGWEMLGQNIQKLAQGMLDGLGEAIATADWSGLGKGIGQALSQISPEDLKEGLKTLANNIKIALSDLWSGFKEGDPEGASNLASGLGDFAKIAGELAPLAITIGVIAAGLKLVSGALVVILPIVSALLPMLGASGGVGLAGALGAIAATLSPIIIAFTLVAGVIAGLIESVIAVKAGFEDGVNGVVSFEGRLITLCGGAIPSLIYYINLIKGRTTKMIEEFQNGEVKINGVLDSISSNFASLFLFARSLWITFKDTISRGIELIENNFTSLRDVVVAIFSGDIRGALNTCIGAIESFLNICIEGIADLASNSALGGIASLANRTIGPVNATTISLPRIPELAQGAVLPPNKPFLAMVGDQSNGTNIEAPLDTIRQAVGEEFAPYFEQMINATLQVVQAVNNKNLVIGDREIGKANARYVNQQKLIKGTML